MTPRASKEKLRSILFTERERALFRKFTHELALAFGFDSVEQMHAGMKGWANAQKDLPDVIEYCRERMLEKAIRKQRADDFMAGLFKDGISVREGGRLTRKGVVLAGLLLTVWLIGGAKLVSLVWGKIFALFTGG